MMTGKDLEGRIIRGVGGFYYVDVPSAGVYACRARGIFRRDKIKPLVGDFVSMDITDPKDMEGNITRIHPRRSALIRPEVANADQALIVFAVTQPPPNLNMLDRFLVSMARQDLETLICFNKTDIAPEASVRELESTYAKSGCPVICTSTVTGEGIDTLRDMITGKTTVLAGPSGVGKSSLMNTIFPQAKMSTGAISERIMRGRHTTRHSELFDLGEDTYMMDTPGFTSLYLTDLRPEALEGLYPEFDGLREHCRFQGCVHIHEPDCRVLKALRNGEISRVRYDIYVQLYEELKSVKRYG